MSNYDQFFKEADVDGSGFLTYKELTDILRKKGYKGSDSEIRSMFRSVDVSGDDKVSKDEYLVAMGQVPERDHKAATMRSVFRQFDVNGDGRIDCKELDEVLRAMGHAMSRDDVNKLIALADKDRNGTLNYEEFIEQIFGPQ